MARDAIVVLCMPERGHLHRLLPVIEGLAARGRRVLALTDARFADAVIRAGAAFEDLFARFPVEAADSESRPVPSRYVSFAGHYAAAVTNWISSFAPALVLYDTFAVVAPIVGRRLGVPYVNFCAGHAFEPVRTVAELRADGRAATSEACWRAIGALRTEHGMPGANPFSYVEALSPYLNLYGEPEPFLPAADRPAFEPLAFFGSLDSRARHETSAASARHDAPARPRIYASFGTVVWRYFRAEALAAFEAIARAAEASSVELLVTTGGEALTANEHARLARPGVRIERYVDQWAILSDCDAFVTHQGLNSTHEAIFHRVPMLAYPFFADQPALTRRAAELGLTLPLVETPRAPLTADAFRVAFTRMSEQRARFASRLAEAQSWELATIAGRPAILDRIEALADGANGEARAPTERRS